MPPFPAGSTAPVKSIAPRGHTLGVVEYDRVSDDTRVSLTTHRGLYLLWIQHPRVTFFYLYHGDIPATPPARVYLVFRTQDPQYPADNRLILECDGTTDAQSAVPTFTLVPGAFRASRYFLYELSLPTVTRFLACGTAAVTVGGITARFPPAKLDALRAFARGMRPTEPK